MRSKTVCTWVSRPAGYLAHLLLKGFLYSSEHPHACPSVCDRLDSAGPCLCSLGPFVLCPHQQRPSHSQDLPAPAHLFPRLWVSPQPPSPASASLPFELTSNTTFPLAFQIFTPGHPLGDDSHSRHKRIVVTCPCLCLPPPHTRQGISLSHPDLHLPPTSHSLRTVASAPQMCLLQLSVLLP